MRRIKIAIGLILILVGENNISAQTQSNPPGLKVSENGHYILTKDGSPFFWLGDTAWRLIEKSCRDNEKDQPSLEEYFISRSKQGFNVLQTRILSPESKDYYGNEPFIEGDFSKPLIRKGDKNDYWDMVDFVIDLCGRYDMYIALLPFWLNSIPVGHQIEKYPEIAYAYGNFLGKRYGDKSHIIWVMGGDPGRPKMNVDRPQRMKMVRSLAEGIADGINGEKNYDSIADFSTSFMTFHPPGHGRSSSDLLHHEPWMDFNMIQTSTRFEFANYETIEKDYNITPPKPTLDSEPVYEYSKVLRVNVDERAYYGDQKRISDWDVRRAAYWSVFSGACGFTYGHRSFIGWILDGEKGGNGADLPWYEGLNAPGAFQMRHLSRLMLSRPYEDRIPDQTILNSKSRNEYGNKHIRATRAVDGSYAMAYSPVGYPIILNMGDLSPKKVVAYWFDPRVGVSHEIGIFETNRSEMFVPPSHGEGQDWVLILDDAESQKTNHSNE